MTTISTHISKTININTLNSSRKRQRLTEWSKKQNPSVVYKKRDLALNTGTNLKNGQKYSNQMGPGNMYISILISVKMISY